MKHLIISIIICLYLGQNTFAQGYNKTYDIGLLAAVFTNIIIENDTVTLIGICLDTMPPYRWGICLVKMDTFGHVLTQKSYYADENFASALKQGFVKLKNNQGYAIVGTHFNSQRGYLLRIDASGNLLYLKQYPKPINSFTYYWNHIVENSDGFYVAGSKQMNNYDNNAFVLRLDIDGNLLWIKDYGGSRSEESRDLIQVNDNELALSVSSVLFTTDPAESKGATQLYGLDSLGNQKWFWESPLGLEEAGAKGLQKLGNRDWVYTALRYIYNDDQNAFEAQPRVIKRDSNFNLVWNQDCGPLTLEDGGFIDLKPYPDSGGGYIGSGYLISAYYESGMVYKITESGDIAWQRSDTAFFIPNGQSNNKLATSDFLSSGSIILCGRTIDYTEPKSYGWVLKISPDGCMDTLLCITSAVEPVPVEGGLDRVQVFPNPASETIVFAIAQHPNAILNITNVKGQTIATLDWKNNQSRLELNVSQFQNGIYFYCLQDSSKNVIPVRGKFLIQH